MALQKLLWVCEQELDSIDMAINAKKSSCMRVGARHEKVCSRISTLNGRELDWVEESDTWVFSLCELTNLNAANSIFAKVGRLASEEVIVQLLKQNCIPILLYGLDVCNLDKRSMHSLDFTVNRFFHEVVSDI